MSRTTLSTLSNCFTLLFILVLLCLLSPSLAVPADLPAVGPTSSPSNTSENQRPLTGPDPSQVYVLYWDEIVLGLIFMVIGIIECFWGYRLIRLSMFFVGYLVFSSLAFFLILLAAGGTLTTSLTGAWIILFVWFLAGFIGSVFCFIFWHLGLAFLAMYGGFQLGLAISGFADIHSYPGRIALIILFMVVLVILTRLEERHVIIVATSLGGAFTFVWGIDEFAHQGFRQMVSLLGPNGSEFHVTPGIWGELVVVILVFAAGTGYEYWAHETPDPSNLFGDGTRRAQEEIKHIEDEVDGAFKKLWGRIKKKKDVESTGNPASSSTPPPPQPPPPPPSSSSPSSSPPPPQKEIHPVLSAWFTSFRPVAKNPSPEAPAPSSSSSSSPLWWRFKPKFSSSSAVGGSSSSSSSSSFLWLRGRFGKRLDKSKEKEGEVPARSWWEWLRRGEPKIIEGQMEDISEITG